MRGLPRLSEAVIDYVAGFDDAKMDDNGCNRFGAKLLEGEQVQRLQGLGS